MANEHQPPAGERDEHLVAAFRQDSGFAVVEEWIEAVAAAASWVDAMSMCTQRLRTELAEEFAGAQVPSEIFPMHVRRRITSDLANADTLSGYWAAFSAYQLLRLRPLLENRDKFLAGTRPRPLTADTEAYTFVHRDDVPAADEDGISFATEPRYLALRFVVKHGEGPRPLIDSVLPGPGHPALRDE